MCVQVICVIYNTIILLIIHPRLYKIEKRVKTRPLYNPLIKSYEKKTICQMKKIEIILISLFNQKLSPQ